MNSKAKPIQCITKIDYFKFLDKNQTIKLINDKLAQYKRKLKANGKRGGVTANTFDVIHALLSCLPPTMADLATNQPDWLLKSIQQNEFFVFTYNKTLATKINNLKSSTYDVLRIHPKTVYNHIKILLEAGILTKKVNYQKTGDNPNTRGYENPSPQDATPSGRGKIQLFFSKDVLFFTPYANHFFDIIKETLPQYSTTCLSSLSSLQESKETIPNKLAKCGKAVFATANAKSICKNGKEQERKFTPHLKISGREFKSRSDFFSSKLLDLCQSEIFKGAPANQSLIESSKALINQHLNRIKSEVEAYRAKKIKSYCQANKILTNEGYIDGKTKEINKLKAYSRHLPNAEMAAIEIFSFAIQKQAKHAKNKGYLHRFNYATDFLTSQNFLIAIDYSFNDWQRIQNNFFSKNIKYSSYLDEVQKLGTTYTTILNESANSIVYAYRLSLQAFDRLKNRLTQNEKLTDSNKKTLLLYFSNKLKPLFASLSDADKAQIKLTLKSA